MGCTKYYSALIFSWLIQIILFSVPVPVCAQHAVDVIIRGEKLSDTILVVHREKTLEGRDATDSFVPVSSQPLRFRITGLRTPETATLYFYNTMFPVFLVPGHNLELFASGNGDGKISFRQDGPAALITSAFEKSFSKPWQLFRQEYLSAGSAIRLQVLDKALESNKAVSETAVRDYFSYRVMRLALDSSASLLDLNDQHSIMQRWQPEILNTILRNDVESRYAAKLRSLIAAQSGKPATLFSLPDSSGKIYRLSDFRGRLVYLDLWASWCLPCRLESPIIQRMVNRYKHNPGIVFIGIAVSDKPADWKKAIKQDKPGWLQLHDRNTIVANGYAATSVPRYVLIDKKGMIIDFHAPAPTDYQRLIDRIEKELQN